MWSVTTAVAAWEAGVAKVDTGRRNRRAPVDLGSAVPRQAEAPDAYAVATPGITRPPRRPAWEVRYVRRLVGADLAAGLGAGAAGAWLDRDASLPLGLTALP